MYSVYQHWDRLKVCVVGKSYPPEFYSFIKNTKLRNLFEKIAVETEEDFCKLENILKSFGVETIRPNLLNIEPDQYLKNNEKLPAPITMVPRDQMIMIGEKFFLFPYEYVVGKTFKKFNVNKKKLNDTFIFDGVEKKLDWWKPVHDIVKNAGNQIIDKTNDNFLHHIPTNGITRCGKDLYFGTNALENKTSFKIFIKKHFENYRCVQTPCYGHLDGWFMPVVPGLLFAVHSDVSYQKLFPNWQTVYIPEENSRLSTKSWEYLKTKNKGKWWIPGFEYDTDLINFVETWLNSWVGYVEETIFDVNLLMIDEKNVICNSYNKEIFSIFSQYGITPHICNLRHRFFWDGGIHCSTLDLNREGKIKDYFPERGEANEHLSHMG